MCGRFVNTQSAADVANYFGASFEPSEDGGPDLGPNYNVAPTQDVLAVVADTAAGADASHTAVRAFHWGLVPVWAKDVKIGSTMINARAETVATKPAFKGVFRSQRCIIPMDGFFEWKAPPPGADPANYAGPIGKNGKPAKQPMYIHRVDGEPLAVAGLWAAWRPKGSAATEPWLHSCSIITTTANATMEPVHDRMPVILPASAWSQWLDPNVDDVDALHQLLVPAPDGLLTMHAVSTEVNNARHGGETLIEPLP